MGYPKGRRGESHWLKDAAWDCCSTAVIAIILISICLCALWIAGQIVTGVIGG